MPRVDSALTLLSEYGGMDDDSVIKPAEPEGVDNISGSDEENEKPVKNFTIEEPPVEALAPPKYIKPTPKLEKDGKGVFIKGCSILNELGN